MKRTGLLWFACAIAIVVLGPAQAPASEIVLYNFACPPKGANPQAGVIGDSSGNLYGTTYYGGTANAGVVYKVDTTGHETVLYSFTGGADGGWPNAGVIRDSAGNLYGTASGGGTAHFGVVYKVDSTGHETVLYSFTGQPDGAYPAAGVIRDSGGNLYGTTNRGGTANAGAVYKLDAGGHETVLYSFTGGADGRDPSGGVIRDSGGNLYGTTVHGGTANAGVVYKLDATGHETMLYSFTGGVDGGYPGSGVIRDTAGNLYGTTISGGMAGGVAGGVVFELDPAGHETVLYSFTSGVNGDSPYTGVIRDSAGNFYGTLSFGGAGNAGVVYKLDATGHETVLHSFAGGTDGKDPITVIRDSAGNLYGTTFSGGTGNVGVVYKLDTTGNETVLYSFPNGDGVGPYAGVIPDSAGNLYGTTRDGGASGAGTVYMLDTTGHETVLYSFTGGGDGGNPVAGVIRDSAGNLYGTTVYGGPANQGVVYKVDTTGHETVLYSFTGGADGGWPEAGVIRDSAGNLYGTTTSGGALHKGGVYKLDTAGLETVLYSFTGGADGGVPYSGVIRDLAGNLYGTTTAGGTAGGGVVYKLDTAGLETVLCAFTSTDGADAFAGVIRDTAGNLYGTSTTRGALNNGFVYKLDAAGHETVLYSFTGGADGGLPYSGVIRDLAGNLYGTTSAGGTAGAGVVYKLDTTGLETVLHSFTGKADGAGPEAGVIRDPAGNLYGTTEYGGRSSSGVIYKIKP
jgi:uncharacterized repeat protein (TIGR03803 family)